jgi:TM2 domain-containing membrane protein YozV
LEDYFSCFAGISLVRLGIGLFAWLLLSAPRANENMDAYFFQINQQANPDYQMYLSMRYNQVKLNSIPTFLWFWFHGGFGALKFYMGQIGIGVVYLLFSWTTIPFLVAFVETFLIAVQVERSSRQKIIEMATIFGVRYLPHMP